MRKGASVAASGVGAYDSRGTTRIRAFIEASITIAVKGQSGLARGVVAAPAAVEQLLGVGLEGVDGHGAYVS